MKDFSRTANRQNQPNLIPIHNLIQECEAGLGYDVRDLINTLRDVMDKVCWYIPQRAIPLARNRYRVFWFYYPDSSIETEDALPSHILKKR